MKSLDGATGTRELLKGLCRGVFRELPKALAGAEEPLHQMRVAGRRLRTVLPFVARKPQGKRVKRALALLRELVREAGASRDLDVCASLLEAHLRSQEPLTPPLKALLKRVRSARNRSRARMTEVLLDLDIAGLRRRLRGCVERPGEGLFTILQRLRQEREVRGDALVQS